MKKLVALLSILVIIMIPIMISVDNVSAENTIYDAYAIANPAYYAWMLETFGWMGLNAQTVGDELDYINRNGSLDDFVQSTWDYWTDENVYIEQGLTGLAVKVSAHILEGYWTKIKEMWLGSEDDTSDYYLFDAPADMFKGNTKVVINEYYGNHATWFNSLTHEEKLFYTEQYAASSFNNIYNGVEYMWSAVRVNDSFRVTRYKLSDSTSTDIMYFIGEQHHNAMIPVISWKNTEGKYTNGTKYRLDVVAVTYSIYYNDWDVYTGSASYCGEVNDSDLSLLAAEFPVEFDNSIAESWDDIDWTTDIDDDDYITIEIPQEYIDAIEGLQEAIATGTATLQDIQDLEFPEVVVKESTNTIIREIIQAQDVPRVDNPDIDWPDITKYKMPTGITTKFPFCIPFDVYRSFTMLQAEQKVPYFEIPLNFTSEHENTIVIDLQQFQGLINVVRWFLLAIFILGLILATRGLIKG